MSDSPYDFDSGREEAADVSFDPNLDFAVRVLNETKPWVRFISVIMFIGSAFMILAGVIMMAGGAANMRGLGVLGGLGAVMGAVYLLMSLLYLIPAVLLWKYADGIAEHARQRTTRTLSYALEAQKSFWKFVGILTLIVLMLYAAALAFACLAAFAR